MQNVKRLKSALNWPGLFRYLYRRATITSLVSSICTKYESATSIYVPGLPETSRPRDDATKIYLST